MHAAERTIGLAGVKGYRREPRGPLGLWASPASAAASRPRPGVAHDAVRRGGLGGAAPASPSPAGVWVVAADLRVSRAGRPARRRNAGAGGGPTPPPPPREEGQRGGSPRVGTPAAGAAGQSTVPWCPGGVAAGAEAGPRAARLRGTCVRDAGARRPRVSSPAGAVRLAPRKCLLAPRGWEEGRERERGSAGALLACCPEVVPRCAVGSWDSPTRAWDAGEG